MVKVFGPELVSLSLQVHSGPGQVTALLHVANRGTESVQPDRIEIWGWAPDSDASIILGHDNIAPIAPGKATLIQLTESLDTRAQPWRIVESGYWLDGAYIAIMLPDQVSSVSQHQQIDTTYFYERLR